MEKILLLFEETGKLLCLVRDDGIHHLFPEVIQQKKGYVSILSLFLMFRITPRPI